MRFSGVMIGSENPKALGEFYAKILGEPGFQEGEWYGWERIMLTVEVDDVQASFDEIVLFGATVVAKPYKPEEDKSNWLATLEDVDGNYLQLATPWE